MANELTTQIVHVPATQETAFSSIQAFESAQRMANALASSALVPQAYQGNVANCIVALELAQRIGASPLMVAQNLHVINGRPSWSAQFIIAALNSCGRFSPLRFTITGQGDDYGCFASAVDKSGEILEGPRVTIAMAKLEGWFDRKGSKWPTMKELMIRYRAAAFFGRLYAPDILMGLRSDEEERDVIDITPTASTGPAPTETAAAINERAKQRRERKTKDAGSVTAEAPSSGGPVVTSGPLPEVLVPGSPATPSQPPPVEGHF